MSSLSLLSLTCTHYTVHVHCMEMLLRSYLYNNHLGSSFSEMCKLKMLFCRVMYTWSLSVNFMCIRCYMYYLLSQLINFDGGFCCCFKYHVFYLSSPEIRTPHSLLIRTPHYSGHCTNQDTSVFY